MNASHQQAFVWLQQEREGRLDSSAHQRLLEHLAACSQCAADARLDRVLTSNLPPYPSNATSAPLARSSAGAAKRQPISDQDLVRRTTQLLKPARRRASFFHGITDAAGWTAAALLLVLFMALAVRSLPGSVHQAGAPAALPVLPSFNRPADPSFAVPPAQPSSNPPNASQIWSSWPLTALNILAGAMPVVLLGLVGLYLITRRHDLAWLIILLAALSAAVVILTWSQRSWSQVGPIVFLASLPSLLTLPSLLAGHLWATRRAWSPLTWLLLGMYLLGLLAVPALLWPDNASLNRSGLPFLLGLGMAPALAWQAWDWRGIWRELRHLALAVMSVGLLLLYPVLHTLNLYTLGWLYTLSATASVLFIPMGMTLAGRLAARLTAPLGPKPEEQKFPASGRSIFGLLWLFALLYFVIYTTALDSSTSEDQISGVILLVISWAAALTAAAALTRQLRGRHLGAALALLAIFTLGLSPAAYIPRDLPARVTAARAETIHQGILDYREGTGAYPENLKDLTPGYVLFLPRPVTFLSREWCYDASPDYFRLGYYYADRYTHPSQVELILHAVGGAVPDTPLPCQLNWQNTVRQGPNRP